jgi:L-seryl-tRNA(Ser) seleniumtransferase
VLYVATPFSRPALPAVAAAAHAAGVPVLVDAAAQLPPASNLTKFIAEGADLVAFSGGKALRGPQASGILCGRRDLVMAATLQMLDMDVDWDFWSPPPALIDRTRLPGAPHHGIGRPCKVGKEEIVGLLTALRLFVAEEPMARRDTWQCRAEQLAAGLSGLPASILPEQVPLVSLALSPPQARDLVQRLTEATPPIHADPSRLDQGVVLFNPLCLGDDEPPLIARAVLAILRPA